MSKYTDQQLETGPLGHHPSQAQAWCDVFDECKRLGMPTDIQMDGRNQVLAFIRDLAKKAGAAEETARERDRLRMVLREIKAHECKQPSCPECYKLAKEALAVGTEEGGGG